jgi:hypothetical protein
VVEGALHFGRAFLILKGSSPEKLGAIFHP